MKSEKRRLTPWTALVFAGLAIWVLDLILMGWRLWLWACFVWWWDCFVFLVGWSIGIVFHELGHLTFAAIGSIPVYQIRIGAGPLLWRSRFGDTWLELRVLPLSGGAVQPYPVVKKYHRFWRALFLLGGVLGNLAVICFMYGLQAIGAAGKVNDIFTPIGLLQALTNADAEDLPNIFTFILSDIFTIIILVQVLIIIFSLIPFSNRWFGTTDGMRLLMLRSRTYAPALAELRKRYNAFLGGNGRADTPFTITPASSRLWFHGSRFLTDRDARPEAREGVLRELQRGKLSREEQIWALDALITDGIISGDPAVRPFLDAWSQQALALGPDRPTLQGSRGAVLVELGRYAEGKALLAPLAAPDQPVSFDSFMNCAFLARAEHGLGNEAAARQLADAARAMVKTAISGETKTQDMIAEMLVRLHSEIPPAGATPIGQFAQ
jgi:hypothetical protein